MQKEMSPQNGKWERKFVLPTSETIRNKVPFSSVTKGKMLGNFDSFVRGQCDWYWFITTNLKFCLVYETVCKAYFDICTRHSQHIVAHSWAH